MKYFAHRGFVNKKSPENSLKAFKNAYRNNFRHIEVDIWFFEQKLVLKHNKPKPLEALDSLNELMFLFKNKVRYWLDFKNINLTNSSQILNQLKKIIEENNIDLKNIYFAPFFNYLFKRTSVLNLNRADKIYQKIRQNFNQKSQIIVIVGKLESNQCSQFYQQLKKMNIYGVSLPYRNIDKKFREIFWDIVIFAWTVNSQIDADFVANIGVENVATDDLKPIITKNK